MIKKKLIKKRKKIYSLFTTFNFKAKIYFLFLFLLTFYTFVIDIIKYVNEENYFVGRFLYYFTIQTIFSILLILFSFFLKIKNKKKYSIFIFIVAVNALLTFFVFNLFLRPFWCIGSNQETKQLNILVKFMAKREKNCYWFFDKNFISSLQHIFIPLFYFVFFFFFLPFKLDKLKEKIYTFAHPLIYLFIFFLISLFSKQAATLKCEKNIKSCWFPYPNIQCPVHGNVFFEKSFDSHVYSHIIVFSRIVVLTLFFAIFFLFIFYLKMKLNKKIIKKG